jgi:hypothetical protein
MGSICWSTVVRPINLVKRMQSLYPGFACSIGDIMDTKSAFILLLVILAGNQRVRAQVPPLPPGNLGLTNMQDGNAPGPGWYYMQYVQIYQAKTISSVSALQQLVFISKTNIWGGNLGGTVIVPFVKIAADGNSGPLSINPSPFGDIVAGPLIQWFNKRLFGMKYGHRLEVDMGIPTGSFKSSYDINPGSHLFRVFPHYTFTLSPTDKLSFSMRHHLNYYFKEMGTGIRPGITYNFNYSGEYTLTHGLTVEIAGYYLTQLEQDSKNGDSHYFQRTYSIADTKERVFAYGPGLGWVTPTGLFIEAKGMWETAARNRTEGFRATLVLSYKLDK